MENWATKEGFFKAEVPREKVTVPDLGDIWIHGLTCEEKDDYEDLVMNFNVKTRKVKMTKARAMLMKMTVRNQHGNRMFGDGDMGRLCSVPVSIIEPILNVARKLSAMATDEIEDLVKNSETGPEGAESGSDSGSPTPGGGPAPKSTAG